MKYDLQSNVSLNVVEGILIVTINQDLEEYTLLAIQESILNKIAASTVKGVILDFSNVKILDSFLIKKIEEITKMIEVMGSLAVVAGLRPETVVSLVTLNIHPEGLTTALNIELAIKMLKKVLAINEIEKDEDNEDDEEHDDENMDPELIDEDNEEPA